MLIHKVALFAGALVVLAAPVAQAYDQTGSGADSIVSDTYNNQRALDEQAQNRAYQDQFRTERQPMVRTVGVSRSDAVDIARAHGVSNVKAVGPLRDGDWMVRGSDARGATVAVRVDSRGDVLGMRRG